MEKIQSLAFWKKPIFILALILGVFFFKGVFLATITPIFVGQDETKHYSSIQYVSEPRPITWPIIRRDQLKEGEAWQPSCSQEVVETVKAVDSEKANDNLYTTADFTQGYDGRNETQINNATWHKYSEYDPPVTAGITLYHKFASVIEKVFVNQSIFVRYYLIRIFSVLLGTLTILFSYLIAKNMGFSAKSSLLMTAIIAFQPRFSIYYAAINYDALLILTFTLFTLGGVLALKNGPNWKNILLIIVSVYMGIQTKPTANILLVASALLFAYLLYKEVQNKNKIIKFIASLVFIFAAIFLSIYIKNHFIGDPGSFGNIWNSVKNYLAESLTMGRFGLSSRTYWGTLSWINNWFLDNMTNFIWYLQAVAGMGVVLFLMLKRKLEHLPEKKYVVFLLLMIVLLQLGIRFADWTLFKQLGRLETGTPGRYFLPNLTAHIILVFTGIGMLLWKKELFEKVLTIFLILMMTFMMYIIFNTIIFRYYL